jgi:hypothetical protein
VQVAAGIRLDRIEAGAKPHAIRAVSPACPRRPHLP